MKLILAVLAALTVVACSGSPPSLPTTPAPAPTPPSPAPASGWIWAMAVSKSGACIEGAAIQIVAGQGSLRSAITQRTPCSVWDYDGGVMFTDLTLAETVTLRASAAGRASVEKTLFPKTGGTVEAFVLDEIR